MKKFAVVLFNLGGPDSLDAIEGFLYNLFSDPDIFKFPFGQNMFAKWLSKRRAQKVRNQYEYMGGSSPINKWTEIQRVLLEEKIRKDFPEAQVFTAMRYWHPLIQETCSKIQNSDYQSIILLPLFPQYSIATTGSSFAEWSRCFHDNSIPIHTVSSYFLNVTYLEAVNQRINEALAWFSLSDGDQVYLLFSAHGLPTSFIVKGDPYQKQIEECVNAVMKLRNSSHKYHLAYQSRVGPMEWLKPYTNEKIAELAKQGVKHLLVIPISFVSDHVETLFELGVLYKDVASKNGIKQYKVMQGLNDSPKFIEALHNEVMAALKESPQNVQSRQ